jgi:IS30 family transposase
LADLLFSLPARRVCSMEYHHLTAKERYLILHHKSNGCSLRQIADILDRSVSTISRELKRNVSGDGRYRPDKADSYARARRWRSRRGSQFEAAEIELVFSLVQRKWSPEQVSNRLRKLRRLDIGTATIYRMLAKEKAQGGNGWLQLRQLSHRYRKGYRVEDRRGRMQGKRPLGDRPAGAEDRSEAGHLEGDTVMGSDGRHCLLTLVDRKTRKLRMIKLPARQASEVNKALIKEVKAGRVTLKSLTLDNGTEFHGFKELEEKLGIQVYFAQPYHSWERGTNENTNGLIRQYLPKRSCFKELTQRQCKCIEQELNDRPRKILGFNTPNEAEAEECCA